MAANDPSHWYEGRTVVVTGAYGYLGSDLSSRLSVLGASVRRATRGRPEAQSDAQAWNGDLLDPEFCTRLTEGADAIFHMAGQTSIKVAEEEPVGDLRANVQSTATLLDACRRHGHRPAFLYGGTATETGVTHSAEPEDRCDRPASVYDANKLAAENLVGAFSDSGHVRGLTLRIGNVYGPGAAKSAADRGVLNKMVERALSGKPLTYYGDGKLVRDYFYVSDLIDAFVAAAPVAPHPTRRNCVISGGKGYLLGEVFHLVADIVHAHGYPAVPVTSVPWPETTHPIDRRSFVGDIAPIRELCGWQPRIALEDGLRRTVLAFAGTP